MLLSISQLIGMPVVSLQGKIGIITELVIEPASFKILAFRLSGHLINRNNNLIDVNSIREYTSFGYIVDSEEELISKDDVIKISQAIDLKFNPLGYRVETKKGSRLGRVTNFTVSSKDYSIQQLIVRRPLIKSFTDPELTIPRKEIVEVNDDKIIVKDEAETIKEKAAHEDFVPNFVNPFRSQEPDLSPARTKTPVDKDTE